MIFLLYDNDDTDMELNFFNVNLMVPNWSLYLADLTSIGNDQLAYDQPLPKLPIDFYIWQHRNDQLVDVPSNKTNNRLMWLAPKLPIG